MNKNLFVENGFVLFPSGITEGAIFEIQDSKITSQSAAWGRIEVWGNENISLAAKFIARNSSIENALCAIANYKFLGDFGANNNVLPPISNKMVNRGGILDLESVDFFNNCSSIDFIENQNKTIVISEITSSSLSRFVNLNFNGDDFKYSYIKLTPAGTFLYYTTHVRVTDAEAISFLGCNFNLEVPLEYYNGITSINSDVRIAERNASILWGAYTIEYIDQTQFTNLPSYCLKANNDGSFKRILTQNTYFSKSSDAIRIGSSIFSKIVNNTIGVLNAGVSFDASTFYTLENNFFNNNFNGIEIMNSGEQINIINNNRLISELGIYTIGRNRGISDLDGGLKFFCNDFTAMDNATADILIDNCESYEPTPSLYCGVSPIQGLGLFKPV